jgi:hypothetical protein
MAAELTNSGLVTRIAKDRHSRHQWRNLFEQFQPFRTYTGPLR